MHPGADSSRPGEFFPLMATLFRGGVYLIERCFKIAVIRSYAKTEAKLLCPVDLDRPMILHADKSRQITVNNVHSVCGAHSSKNHVTFLFEHKLF